MPVPDPVDLFHHGTFLVIRQLEQRLGRFDALTGDMANRSDLDRVAIGDKLVGRRRDGTPLATAWDPSDASDNQFLFHDDPEGLACPVASHVRRVNPRDSLGFNGALTDRHRMIRRGMPYREEGPRDFARAGLVFVCLVARPADQFEFIQIHWVNDGDALRLGRSPDPVSGTWNDDRSRIVSVPGPRGPVFGRLAEPLTIARSGGYFLLPSMAGLAYLARSSVRSASPSRPRRGGASGG